MSAVTKTVRFTCSKGLRLIQFQHLLRNLESDFDNVSLLLRNTLTEPWQRINANI